MNGELKQRLRADIAAAEKDAAWWRAEARAADERAERLEAALRKIIKLPYRVTPPSEWEFAEIAREALGESK